MLDKRKLEALLLEDIETATQAFAKNVNTQRLALINRLEAKPSKEVQELLKLYQDGKEAARKAEKKMGELGWQANYNDASVVIRTYGTMPKELVEFDDKVNATKAKLAQLTRTYTLKLFGRGVEAQNLFSDLAKEVAKLVS